MNQSTIKNIYKCKVSITNETFTVKFVFIANDTFLIYVYKKHKTC